MLCVLTCIVEFNDKCIGKYKYTITWVFGIDIESSRYIADLNVTCHHLFARFGWCHKLPFSKPPPNPTIDVMDATAARDGQKTFKVKQRERTAMGQEELQSSNHLAKWWCFIISPTWISLKTLGDFSKAQLLTFLGFFGPFFRVYFGRVRSWWTLTSEVIFIKTCWWTSHCDY